jgi:hypothetical protein
VSESVDFLSFLDMYWPVFLVLLVCVCVCFCVHLQTNRQTNRHSRGISEIVPERTLERLAKKYLSLIPFCFGYNHTNMHTCASVYVYI